MTRLGFAEFATPDRGRHPKPCTLASILLRFEIYRSMAAMI